MVSLGGCGQVPGAGKAGCVMVRSPPNFWPQERKKAHFWPLMALCLNELVPYTSVFSAFTFVNQIQSFICVTFTRERIIAEF